MAEFKGHVESRGRRRGLVQLDTGHIVDRITTALDQRNDPIQPARPALKLQRCPGKQSEGTDAADVGKKDEGEGRIVRNIQENEVLRSIDRLSC